MSTHVLIVVQNLPLPGDRRVWLECQALRAAGFEVSAITPAGPGDPAYALLDGVHLYKYPPPSESQGAVSFAREFAYCWALTARLSRRVWKRRPFDVMQACNPPDTFWALALLYRPRGVKFVFDQHDLSPEVYLSRFSEPNPILLRMLYALERMTYRTASRVIATNESYAHVARSRGRVDASAVAVVRTGPDSRRMRRGTAVDELRRGKRHLACYLGVMNPQDGVDVLLAAIRHIVHDHHRHDTHFALLGGGDAWNELRRQVTDFDLDGHVDMPGRVSDETLFDYLSTADVGLSPDPPSALNDVSTMNKTMEYMAFGMPVVAFDLKETRVSAQEAAAYAAEPTSESYAHTVMTLLDDEDRRRDMGAFARARVESHLDWSHQKPVYVRTIGEAASVPAP